MAARERLRGPVSLVALSASYVLRRPAAAIPAARIAFQVGVRARAAPILRPDPDLFVDAAELVPVCTLVSDTHVVAPRKTPCELDHEPWQWSFGPPPSSEELTDGVRRVLEHVARDAPHTVVWCGDEVDTGDPSEWRRWQSAVDAVPGLAHRLVPGNHDICFNRPFDEDYDLARRALRERAYQQYAGRLADFPVVDTIVGDAGPVTIVLLDSCRHRSTHVLSNAVGFFGDEQLDELARLLRDVHGPVLCVAHHHVWRDETFMQPDDWYNIAVDADRLAAILGRYRRRDARNQVMICHGHRHDTVAGRLGDPSAPLAIVGLPSTTLGDKHGTGILDGIMRYGIAGLRRDGTWGVALREVGPLVDRSR
jgi:hypothetical protein